MFQHILVAVDFSDKAQEALRLATKLAQEGGAHLTVLNVLSTPHVISGELDMTPVDAALWGNLAEELRASSKRRLDAWITEVVPPTIEVSIVVREGYPPWEIVSQAEEGGHDLVVMGAHGRTGLRGAFVGSVTRRVLRKCTIPVLVAPGG